MVARTRAQAMKASSSKASAAQGSASGDRRGRGGRRDPSPRGILRRGGASPSRTSSSAASRKGKSGAVAAASARGKVGAVSAASAQAKVGAASAASGKAKLGASSAASGSRGASGPMKSKVGAGSAASARSKRAPHRLPLLCPRRALDRQPVDAGAKPRMRPLGWLASVTAKAVRCRAWVDAPAPRPGAHDTARVAAHLSAVLEFELLNADLVSRGLAMSECHGPRL